MAGKFGSCLLEDHALYAPCAKLLEATEQLEANAALPTHIGDGIVDGVVGDVWLRLKLVLERREAFRRHALATVGGEATVKAPLRHRTATAIVSSEKGEIASSPSETEMLEKPLVPPNASAHVKEGKGGEREEKKEEEDATTLSHVGNSDDCEQRRPFFLSKRYVRYLALGSLLVQSFNMTLMYNLHRDADPDRDRFWVTFALVVPAVIQIFYLAHELYVCVRIVQLMSSGSVTLEFMAQAFFCVMFGFTGLHQLIHAADQNAYAGLPATPMKDLTAGDSLWLMSAFFYFSCTTITTTGYGDITPTQWYSRMVTCSEQLSGVLFTSAILAIGMNKFSNKLAEKEAEEAKERSRAFAALIAKRSAEWEVVEKEVEETRKEEHQQQHQQQHQQHQQH